MLIVECGTDPAVAFAGRLLARMGDRVVKVEFLPAGDPVRRRQPLHQVQARKRSAGVLFHYLNQGKQSLALDTTAPDAEDILHRLFDEADAVLLDGGLLDRPLFASLVDRVAADVLTVVSPFGLEGPSATNAATSGTIFALSGEASILPGGMGYARFPDAPPLLARGHVADCDAGVIATLVTLAGLYGRSQGVERSVFDVSKQECETSLNRWLVTHYRLSGWIESRATRAYSYGGLVECLDGYVMLQPTTDAHWRGLVEMMGNPPWCDDPRFATQESRSEAGTVIQQHVAAWARATTKQDIFTAGLRLGVPVAPFRDMSEVAACPQYRSRGFFVGYGEAADASGGVLPGLPFRPHPGIVADDAVAPDLGQHSARVLTEVLGLAEDRVRELFASGAVVGAEQVGAP